MLVKPQDYIGKITYSRIPYYNARANEMKMKSRPVLIIGAEKETFPCDFNVLPVSRITNEDNVNELYDFKIDKNQCQAMNLKKWPSFIRVHKQSTCYSTDIDRRVCCDMSKDHKDLYNEIVDLFAKYNETLF